MKTYCYALRATLALLWIRGRAEPPPMDLPALLEGIALTADLQRTIAELVTRKGEADEKGRTARLPVLDALIADSLAAPVDQFVLPDRRSVQSQAESLFRNLVLGAEPAAGLD